MSEALAHRGPDDGGAWTGDGVGFGHRRLSIVDLGGGHQPMSNEDGTVWIVFNGEIYNHRELRSELEGLGHIYRSQSDTETIIHLYEQWGRKGVTKLRGMFAFAIWDAVQRKLVLVRDRLGHQARCITQ
jgi:asparagine synthase (glutamine-hydrolysing)